MVDNYDHKGSTDTFSQNVPRKWSIACRLGGEWKERR